MSVFLKINVDFMLLVCFLVRAEKHENLELHENFMKTSRNFQYIIEAFLTFEIT